METQEKKVNPKLDDVIVHKGNKDEDRIIAIYADGGVKIESGDFWRLDQLTAGQPGKWKANCGVPEEGCCQKRKS